MKYIKITIILLVGFSLGTYFGFRYAPMEFIYSDAQYKASIHAYHLKMLKSAQIEQLISITEINLNAELANYGRYLNSNLKWLLPYPYKNKHDSKAITHAVNYRLENSFTEPDLSSTKSWKKEHFESEFVQTVIKEQKESLELVKMVLDKYNKQ